MRRFFVAGLVLTVLFGPIVSAAPLLAFAEPAPEVTVALGSTAVEGRGWEAGTPLTVTLRGPKGGVRAVCTSTPMDVEFSSGPIPGYFACSWGSGILFSPTAIPAPEPTLDSNPIRPGDTLTIDQGPASVTSAPLGEVALRHINVTADTVSGQVPARNRDVFVRISPSGFYEPPPPEFEAYGRAARDGSFTLDLSAQGDINRFDSVVAGYVAGVFRVVRSSAVPGLRAAIGSNTLSLTGYPGKRYMVRLFAPSGRQKAVAAVTVGGGLAATAANRQIALGRFFGGYTPFSFVSSSGQPINVRTGDTIQVRGWNSFSCRVPKLVPGFDGDSTFVDTVPNSLVLLGASSPSYGFSTVGMTDANGLFLYSTPPDMLPLAPGDMAFASVRHRGNIFSAQRYLAPVERR